MEKLVIMNQCKTSCSKMFKCYILNMPFHGLLDWRLGLSYLRTFLDSNYTLFDGNFDFFELANLNNEIINLKKVLIDYIKPGFANNDVEIIEYEKRIFYGIMSKRT